MKLKLSLLILVIFSLAVVDVAAQDNKKKNKQNKGEQVQEQVQLTPQSNSLRPYRPEQNRTVKNKSKKKNKDSFAFIFNKQLDNKVDEFYERMEDNARRNRKLEKKMEHPRYSDFSYFGHKKKPKIRPVGKRKFCKECGIVH